MTMEKSEIMEWLADEIVGDMEYNWEKHARDYNFTECNDPVPYGDTYVSSGSYVDEREVEECCEEFADNFDTNEFIDSLKTNVQFCEALKEMAKNIAYNG